MTKADITIDDLKAQNAELGTLSMGSFMKETQGSLSFFDGIKWNRVASRVHFEQMERALEAYLDKQLEQVEYTMTLALSQRRGVLFETYQKAIMEISDRIRTQTIAYRDKTKTNVLGTIKTFLEDKNEFNNDVDDSGNLTDEDRKLLKTLNAEATGKNVTAIYNEMIAEFDHYTDMCQRIYIGMAQEIEHHRTIDITPS